jgi:hypothetical protein
MKQNPFIYRGMLKSSRLFMGRQLELNHIYSCLLDSEDEPQSVAILGQRRIGKSSLLYRIFKKERADEMYAEQLENTITVMISMQNLATSAGEEFYERILDDIRSVGALYGELVDNIRVTYENDQGKCFEQLLRKLTSQGLLLIVLIDEFEAVSKNPAFDLFFFNKLRALMQERRLAFVISVQTDIEYLWGGALINSPHSSPFFNVFHHATLREFTDEETEKYLNQFSFSDKSGAFSEDDIALIHRFAGNHPFFINIAAYHLFENKISGDQLSLDEVNLEIERDPTVRSIYKYYLNTLAEQHRTLLVRLVLGEIEYPYNNEIETGLHWLFKLSLIEKLKDGTYSPFSESFLQFLKQQSSKKNGKVFAQTESGEIFAILSADESANLEFKSSLRWDYRENQKNEGLEIACLKTLAAFLNTHGGTLIIGVDDQQKVLGLEKDYMTLKKSGRDAFQVHLYNIVKSRIGTEFCELLEVGFPAADGIEICKVVVQPSAIPAFVDKEKLFYRTGNSTDFAKTNQDSYKYIVSHWQNNGNIKFS